MPASLLYAYGSLRKGQQNPYARMLETGAEWLGGATVSGRIQQVSWYTALVETGNPQDVAPGEVWKLTDDERMLAALDAYEGEEFRRVARRVRLTDGSEVEAWAYIWTDARPGLEMRSDD